MKRKIALGPGAASLILIVVALSLCMMSMLTIIAAKNDYSLCSRSSSMIERVFALSAQSERKMAELDQVLIACRKDHPDMESYLSAVEENLPEGMSLEEDQVTWTEPLDNRVMECIVQLNDPSEETRMTWVSHKLTVNEPEDDWEW